MKKKRRHNIVLYFIIAIFLFGCSATLKLTFPPEVVADAEQDWLTLGRNNLHQFYATEDVVPPLQIVWKKRIKGVVADHPLAYDNYILIPVIDGMIYQIDYKTGEEVGNGRMGFGMEHVSTIHDNAIYSGFNVGHPSLLGLNLQMGEPLLRREDFQVTTTPLIWDDRMYFGTNQWVFLCINPYSGEEIWRFEAKAPIRSSPALQEPAVIFADEKGWVYSLDASSGILLWEQQLEGNTFSHPVITGSHVFIGTTTGKFYAIQIKDGKISWQKKFHGAIFSSPSVYKDKLYVGNNNHEVVCLQQETGEILWRFITDGIVNTIPLPSPEYLYVTSWDKNLYVLDRESGELVFKMEFRKPLKTSPIIYKNLLFLHVANDRLYALTNASLAKNWGKQE